MKTTDEMRYGESLRTFCDCNQGRLPCSCGKVELLRNGQMIGRITRKISSPPELAAPYGSELQADAVERFGLEARLQLMQGLALLGWAAFILKLMGV